MGNDPKTSVLNPFNQMYEVPLHDFILLSQSLYNLLGAHGESLLLCGEGNEEAESLKRFLCDTSFCNSD